MAAKKARPGRRLLAFLGVVAVMFGLIALDGTWAPKLGLDLQGGTRITLQASTLSGESVSQEKLDEATSIIDSRVNGSGVSEAEVGTQGSDTIVVEIPGQNATSLVNTVKQTAQLRFRLVAGQPLPGSAAATQPAPSSSMAPSGTPSAGATDSASPSDAGTANRPAPLGMTRPLAEKTKSPSARPSGSASPSESGSPTAQPSSTATTTPPQDLKGAPVDKPLQWMDDPGAVWLAKFQNYTCPKAGDRAPIDDPSKPLITCDKAGKVKYLLSAAMIEGTQLKDAAPGAPNQQQAQWSVNLQFDSSARSTFADVTQQLAGTGKQFAIVLDGKVISAPTVINPILGGNAQITGSFNQQSASTLANSLKYGALPLRFTVPVVSQEGPSLAEDQLSAGITAGIIGLLLVMIYCLFYYRGLGLVVISSLLVAGGVTYATVLFMSATAGFTLTLPGIAGLIVAVGITADSFIVYFERIRDEMRDGRTMRVAVENGWARARNTCLAADAVSLLAAVVLYIFAIGVVKGFAFALGISTIIDIVVFFLFTKPMVSWLAQFSFFSSGHKLSGLDAENLGVDHLPGLTGRTAGGRA